MVDTKRTFQDDEDIPTGRVLRSRKYSPAAIVFRDDLTSRLYAHIAELSQMLRGLVLIIDKDSEMTICACTHSGTLSHSFSKLVSTVDMCREECHRHG